MSTEELRKRFIEEIEKNDNEYLLGEVYRLLQIEAGDTEIYKLNNDQKQAITEARNQIKNGHNF